MSRLLPASLIAAALFLGTPVSAFALSLRGRPATGVVVRVNHPAHEVELDRSSGAPARALRWNRATAFAACGREADARILKPGARVAVAYLRPIFGAPYLTKVTRLGGTCRCAHRCG